ncbi:DgyrCDS5347 [Dimorphilus gyrociliatus]|uniref:Transmembrane protein 254 n=1 Tax=Dimorphilus gyrociliatus TaxID=2664684 RepID=A0A7I8VLY7_9ANNE|nr:DgyrCDS5347 [Dimorphilus gyrociliatus]
MARNFENYYRFPSIFSAILVPIGMALTTVVAFAPELLRVEILGPLGIFLSNLEKSNSTLMTITAVSAWSMHVFEAIYAYHLCKSLKIKKNLRIIWSFQTFIYGIFSLIYLLKKTKENKKSN